MSKRTTFTTISPLPAGITREVVIDFLHDHQELIDLNPLIIERHPIAPPPHAPDEEIRCVWWSLTDKIAYLPGGLVSGQIEYTAAFNDLPDGVQTHCYAPLGTDIRERWSLGGSLPGEPREPVEIGLGAPRQGLYLREDVELRCNFVMAGFVKKTLKNAHGALVERLCQKAAAAVSLSKNQSQSQSQSPKASFHDGSIHSHAGSSNYNNHNNSNEAGTETDGTYYNTENRPSSSSQYSGRQVHHSQQLAQPAEGPNPNPNPNSYRDASRQQKYVPYRKPVPPAGNGPTNSWAGVHHHQQAPAELQ